MNVSPILVVEDEPFVLKFISSALRKMECTDVCEAANLQDAMGHLSSRNIAGLITDITLPDGDGRELASYCLNANPSAIVVLMTGHDPRDLELSPILREKVLLLEKPFTFEAICQAFSSRINRSDSLAS